MIWSLIEWLTQDADSPKHSTSWKHPMAAWFLHFGFSSVTIVTFHDSVLLPFYHNDIPPIGSISLCQFKPHLQSTKSTVVAGFCFVYAILLLGIRISTSPPGVHRYGSLYGFAWLCNMSLFFGGPFGLATCRPDIATGFAVAVSIDQLLWYVDVLGYVYNRLTLQKKKKMFPIGVCQYLVWKQTQWSSKITCTHHFWTMPLLIYAANGIDWGAYFMNTVTVASYVLLSRWLIPFGLNSDEKVPNTSNEEGKQKSNPPKFEKYMNVNLSHELWQDIRIGILRRQADNQAAAIYLSRLIVWWMLFNLFCFLLLRTLTGILQNSSASTAEL